MPETAFVRGLVRPQTANAEARTVDLVASTESWVERIDLKGRYLERLEITAGAVDLSRLQGMPLLDSHRQDGLERVLGVVRAARIEGRQLIVTAEFSARAEAVWQDVLAGIISNVSVGYRVDKWADAPAPVGSERRRTATRWTPLEVSIVPIGADPKAKARGKDMPETAAVPETTNPPPAIPTRKEINIQIRAMARTMGLGAEFTDPLIDDEASLEDAQAAAIAQIGERRAAAPAARVTVIGSQEDPNLVAGRMGEALYATRANPRHELSEAARPYAHLSTLDMARQLLTLRGHDTTGSAHDVITRALQTTGDYTTIFADTANRVMRERYQAAPNVLKSLARQKTAKDFRAMTSVQFAETGALEKVNEHGEYKRGSFVEAKESFAIDTYGKIWGLSRKALINDDLGAFIDMAGKAGATAAEFEADFLVDLLTAGAGLGPLMDDTNRLFHAEHGNIAAADAAPSETTLSAARLAMRRQTGINGRAISVTPKYILAPPDLETETEKLLSTVQAAQTSNVNPFAGKLELLVEARLTDPNRWYIIADPAQVAGLTYAYLAGSEGPQIETRAGFEVDGVETKVRLDYGAGFEDWRAWYTNGGAGGE
nr:prohead protease/major capsid protein fusion protein [uncultured Sphaerochaeta sp.]